VTSFPTGGVIVALALPIKEKGVAFTAETSELYKENEEFTNDARRATLGVARRAM